jgi:hypothetical protein
MAALQVKDFPDELRARLVERARQDGVTMSEYVLRVLRRDLERLTMSEWLARHPPVEGPPIDVVELLGEVRVEYAADTSGKRASGRSGSGSGP